MKLREIRLYRKKTQKEIAEYCNIERSTYSRYETGDCEPSVATLLKIAKLLDVTVSAIIGDESPAASLAPDESDILDCYRSLSAEGREYIRQQLAIAQKIYVQSDALPELEAAQ